MSYTLKNGTDQTIIVAAFEGQETFAVEAGGEYSTESYRLALSAPDHGLTVSKEDIDAAHNLEQSRQVREDAGGYVEPSPAGINVTTPAGGVVFTPPTVEQVAGLKGRSLDEALAGLGLAKTGTVEEKRTRIVEHLQGTQVDEDDDDATVDLTDDEVTESLTAFGVEVGDDVDADARRQLLRERIASDD